MSNEAVDHAEKVLRDGFVALATAAGSDAGDEDLIAVLRVHAWAERATQRAMVDTVADMQRRGVFARHGQRPETALADLWGVERRQARRVVTAAEQATPRVDLQGQVLPARLPGTAAAFAAGDADLQHVEVIARLMGGPVAARLSPQAWAGAEEQIAAHTGDYTPTELRTWGRDLLNLLDQDGAEPDDPTPEPVNDLSLTPNADGTGGRIVGRFDAALYDLLAGVIDAKAAPLTNHDTRPLGQRQAEAMAEVFGYVTDHADHSVVPSAGGRRPHINVLIRLEDLQNRARAALLDFGGVLTPAALRWLCCDACVVPIVLDGAGQPLDVGRAARTIPDGLRKAVAARDRGCAHPGCDRPVSWCEIHHITPWELGGETKLSNLVMLCRVHHRETHFSDWAVRIAPDGQPEFFPPLWLDPEQKPRRKPHHNPAASPPT